MSLSEKKKNVDIIFSKQHDFGVESILRENWRAVVLADSELDLRHATDMVIVDSSVGSVGVRVRRPGYDHYRDFTVRFERESGALTEYIKIKNGEPRWYFYGWLNLDGVIFKWLIIDMDIFRGSGLINNYEGPIWNECRQTSFVCWKIIRLKTVGAIVKNSKGLV